MSINLKEIEGLLDQATEVAKKRNLPEGNFILVIADALKKAKDAGRQELLDEQAADAKWHAMRGEE